MMLSGPVHLVLGPQPQDFCLSGIQSQPTGTHPRCHVVDTAANGSWCVTDRHGEVDLAVVSVLV